MGAACLLRPQRTFRKQCSPEGAARPVRTEAKLLVRLSEALPEESDHHGPGRLVLLEIHEQFGHGVTFLPLPELPDHIGPNDVGGRQNREEVPSCPGLKSSIASSDLAEGGSTRNASVAALSE